MTEMGKKRFSSFLIAGFILLPFTLWSDDNIELQNILNLKQTEQSIPTISCSTAAIKPESGNFYPPSVLPETVNNQQSTAPYSNAAYPNTIYPTHTPGLYDPYKGYLGLENNNPQMVPVENFSNSNFGTTTDFFGIKMPKTDEKSLLPFLDDDKTE